MSPRNQPLPPRCVKCDGDGLISVVATIECQVCNGTGEVLGSICLICAGPGAATIETQVICDQCSGIGYVVFAEQKTRRP